eukprot:7384135-Prymnesium_polylepis.2
MGTQRLHITSAAIASISPVCDKAVGQAPSPRPWTAAAPHTLQVQPLGGDEKDSTHRYREVVLCAPVEQRRAPMNEVGRAVVSGVLSHGDARR